MFKTKKTAAPLVTCLMMTIAGSTLAATDVEIDDFFHPYAKGFPTAPGVKEGIVIDKNNADQFKTVLAPMIYQQIKAGNTTITIGKNYTAPTPQAFIDASKKTAATVKVAFGQGKIEGYQGGLPFPTEPSASDPNAAEKMVWNNRYGIEVPDDVSLDPFIWEYRDANSGKINRTISFSPGVLSNMGYRTFNAPKNLPGSDEFYNEINLLVKAPQDLKDTAVLFKRRIDGSRDDDGQLYLGFQRRARRLSTAATTDPFLGSTLMVEEFRGFNGKVNEFTWKYVGTKNMLLPYTSHNDVKKRSEYQLPDWRFTAFGGKGGCWQQAPWSLRKTYIVEMTPKRSDHPVSRRTMYLDAESLHATLSEVYDRKGEAWKLWMLVIGHPSGQLPATAKKGVWVWDSSSMLDMQANQCTTLNYRIQLDPIPPETYTLEFVRSRQ